MSSPLSTGIIDMNHHVQLSLCFEMASNFQSSCLNLLSARIVGVGYHAWLTARILIVKISGSEKRTLSGGLIRFHQNKREVPSFGSRRL